MFLHNNEHSYFHNIYNILFGGLMMNVLRGNILEEKYKWGKRGRINRTNIDVNTYSRKDICTIKIFSIKSFNVTKLTKQKLYI